MRFTASAQRREARASGGFRRTPPPGMTATETITSNPRVLGADPLVEYRLAKGALSRKCPGAIGEEDIASGAALHPHRSARACSVSGQLLQTYGHLR